MFAFFGAAIPLASLALLGVKWALKVLVLASCAYAAIQTITFSLFLYGAELYPTHIRALGVGIAARACVLDRRWGQASWGRLPPRDTT